MSALRSIAHLLWMALTVVPYTLAILLASLVGVRGAVRYRIAAAWLSLSVSGARVILGIQTRITGMENLPEGITSPAVLLVKHQSTFETFLMPAIMPHPLAYVFKKELLFIPFFGWSIGCLDMIHIDRSLRTQAFKKVVAQGKERLASGVWIIMFPEGTRTERGQKGVYETSGTRLAVQTGAPVIPIAVTSGKCWPRRAFLKTPGIVDVSIGKPIPSVGRHHKELMQEVETWIEAEMRRLDPEAYAP
ncbi:MAG: 1-acyl-sn-glycerol-3-phosphate acyltransferase [Rhodoferax sp.]|nr:1-acyl-sn-glycerol-3-phosphate acyltransferase [Rhodoferax sp.]